MQVAAAIPCVFILVMFCPWGLLEAKEDKLLCFRTQSIDTSTLVSFILRGNGTNSKPFRLYLSIWNEDRQLIYCKTNKSDEMIERYLSLCKGKQRPQVVELSANSFNLSAMIGEDSRCDGRDTPVSEKNGPQETQSIQIGRQTARTRTRTKRAIIFPGTLWCGTGSKAFEYQQLGMFAQTDRCCREHDHCSSVIRAFSVNFGVFNHNFFTISHCDCDHRFRQCLMEVNDAISHMVGYSFFNFLKVPCFEFTQRKHCSMVNWWGRCTEIQMAPYAVLQTQAQYNTTSLTKVAPSTASPAKTVKPSVKHPSTSQKKQPVDCGKTEPDEGENFQPKAKKRRKTQCRKAKNTTQNPLITQSVMPALQNISFPTKLTTFSTVEDVNDTQTTKSVFFDLQTTTQPSTTPDKHTTWSQIIATEKLRNISSTQSTAASTTHSSLNQGTSLGPRPSIQPTEPRHQPKGCGPRTYPRGDTFLPGHSEEEGCLETGSAPDTGKDNEQHFKGMIQIPVAMKSSLDKTTGFLNEVAAQAMGEINTTAFSDDYTVKTTKSPQERPKSLMRVPTASTVVSSREITTVSQGPAIISRNQTRITISTLNEITSSSKQKTHKRTSTHKPKSSPGGNTVKNTQKIQINSAASAASKMSSKSAVGKSLCNDLKDLDDCAHKILPFERRYGYYNNESKNMYHCDCTHRLSGHLRNRKDAKAIQTLIHDHVSLHCFGLQSSKNCSKSTRCSAVVFPATGLLVALRKMDSRGIVMKQIRPKRYKRRTPVLLYKRCLKIMQTKIK